MGTFHHGKSDLHGITVGVDTDRPEIFVGRCDDIDEGRAILLDADEHRAVDGAPTKAEYVEKVARFGAWKKFDRLVIPRDRVTAVTRLGEH